MARISGLKDFQVQLTKLASAVQSEKTVELVRESWEIVENQIRSNAYTANLIDTGLMVDPNSIITNAGISGKNSDKPVVFAEAGVFKHDSTMSLYEQDPKTDIPSSMYAYWLEFGTQDHYNVKGVRVRKVPVSGNIAGDGTKLNVVSGIKPTKFISRAFDAKADEAFNHFRRGMDLLIEQAVRR